MACESFVEHLVGSLYFLQQKLFLRFSKSQCCWPFSCTCGLGFLPAEAGQFFFKLAVYVTTLRLLLSLWTGQQESFFFVSSFLSVMYGTRKAQILNQLNPTGLLLSPTIFYFLSFAVELRKVFIEFYSWNILKGVFDSGEASVLLQKDTHVDVVILSHMHEDAEAAHMFRY